MHLAVVVPNYNSGTLVIKTVGALLAQELPKDVALQVVVVDDGSTDASAGQIAEVFGAQIILVRLGQNRGRSTARNAGVAATAADVIIFVDSDCIPSTNSFVKSHVEAVRRGVQLSFGNITTPGPGFWDRLQRDAAKWRLKALQAGRLWTFTTQNVAVTRDFFDRAGGFNPLFDRYGFEDRDLFINVASLGAKTSFTEDARVVHADRITLGNVCRKLGEAGLHSAWEFDDLHPDEYSAMHFSRLDCRRRPWLTTLDMLLWPFVRRLSSSTGTWLELSAIPFGIRSLAARLIYGLCFLHGTVSRKRAAGLKANAIS